MNYRVGKYNKFRVFANAYILTVASVTTDTTLNNYNTQDVPKMPSGWREVGGSQHVCSMDLRATCVHGWVLAITCDQATALASDRKYLAHFYMPHLTNWYARCVIVHWHFRRRLRVRRTEDLFLCALAPACAVTRVLTWSKIWCHQAVDCFIPSPTEATVSHSLQWRPLGSML